MSDSYVTSKATLKCSCGDRMAKLTVYPDRTIELTVKPMANISDHISMYNISSFGRCHTTKYPPTGAATSANHGHLTPMPCVPGTITDWINGKDDYFLRGKPALLKSSYCRCRWGGIIRIVADGQIDTGPADLSREDIKTEEEMKTETEERLKLDLDAVLDGIQLALDAAGLAPGVGAIPDLLNASISAIRGDWAGAGLSIVAAVPLVGDVATAAKFAKTGVKTAKVAKKTGSAVKTTSAVGQPLGTVVSKQTTNTPTAIQNKPLLSVTAKKVPAETPKEVTHTSKFGSMTIDGRKPASPSLNKKDVVVENVVDKPSEKYPDDSLKEVFKYKGNQPSHKDVGNGVDLSF